MSFVPWRLQPGDDLRAAIEVAGRSHWPAGAYVVCGIGSLAHTALRYAGEPQATCLSRPLEILTLSGTVTIDGAHLHASVSDADGRVFGGHVAVGCIVRTTVELLLCPMVGWDMGRQFDAQTGYPELVIRRQGDPPAG